MAADVYFLVHVPKCAGTTVEAFVTANFPRAAIAPLKRRSPGRWFSTYYEIPRNADFGTIEFVMGHYFGRSIGRHFPGRTIRQAILLRDPAGFLFSYYSYRMAGHERRHQSLYDFELYYRGRAPNPISFFILNRYLEIPRRRLATMSEGTKFELLETLLRGFWHVGAHDHCGDLIRRVAAEKGVEARYERRNATPKHFLHAAEFRARWAERILAENALDALLFERFCTGAEVRPPARAPTARDLANLVREVTRPVFAIRARFKRDHGI